MYLTAAQYSRELTFWKIVSGRTWRRSTAVSASLSVSRAVSVEDGTCGEDDGDDDGEEDEGDDDGDDDDEEEDDDDDDDDAGEQTCIRQSQAKKSQHWQRAKQCACMKMHELQIQINITRFGHTRVLLLDRL